MKASLFYILPLLAALAACSSKGLHYDESYVDEKVAVELAASPANGGAAATPPAVSAGAPQLAYEYAYGFDAAPAGLDTLIAADQAACAKAGTGACQMLSMKTDSSDYYVRKTLELRVTPEWLKAWQAGLDAGLKRANGRIRSQSITSEDLSLQIVDTDAHLQNKLALRDRLRQIISSGAGKVGDLVEAETQLSQVQGEIDAAQSTLAVLRSRVATVRLTLEYHSQTASTRSGTFAPVTDALANAFDNMMLMVGGLITFIAFLLPIAVVAAPLLWLLGKWLRKRKLKKAAEKAAVSE